MVQMGGRRTARRFALVALLVWLIGVEVGPDLHLALHDVLAPHTHAGDVTVFAAHRHADGSVHELAAVPRPKRARRAAEHELALRLAHGAHSLAHHAAALPPAPPLILAPLPVDRLPLPVVPARIDALVSCAAPLATARGPPLAAV
jgi:hypothetical protein